MIYLQYLSAFILLRRSSSVSCKIPSVLAFSKCDRSSGQIFIFLSWNFWNFLLKMEQTIQKCSYNIPLNSYFLHIINLHLTEIAFLLDRSIILWSRFAHRAASDDQNLSGADRFPQGNKSIILWIYGHKAAVVALKSQFSVLIKTIKIIYV